MPSYTFEHHVSFEETSLVGNVYYGNYILWQGHCRERFIADHCPDVLELLLNKEIALFTRSCECDFTGDGSLTAGDQVRIEMALEHFRGGRMKLLFHYFATGDSSQIATGRQVIHCKSNKNRMWIPDVFPVSMMQSLLDYADSPADREELLSAIEFKQQPALNLDPDEKQIGLHEEV